MNLLLYRNLLEAGAVNAGTRRLLRAYLDKNVVREPARFSSIAAEIESRIDQAYSRFEPHWLFWDMLFTGLSPDSSRHWKAAVRKPQEFPFFRRIRTSISEVADWSPDLVGISMISDTQILPGLSVASGIRSKLPHARIVIGGQALRARRDLLSAQAWLFEIVDAVCISHGEPALKRLVQQRPLDEVPNILWRDAGTVRRSRATEAVTFGQSSWPDFSIMRLDEYLSPERVIPMETARGCAWSRCSFCGHRASELPRRCAYIPRSLTDVIQEVQAHIARGYRKFSFVDEVIPPQRLHALSARLAAIAPPVTWICYIRAEPEHNPSTFRLARRSGCRKVFLGIETGSARLLRLHRKGSTPETARRVVREASEAGLAVHLFFIIGFPDESDADYEATADFLVQVAPFVDSFGFTYDIFELRAEMGTPLYTNPLRFGATGFMRTPTRDLRCDFGLISSCPKKRLPCGKVRARFRRVVEQSLRGQPGLRHLEPFDDSTHLLLIDAHASGAEAGDVSEQAVVKTVAGSFRGNSRER